MYPNDTMGSSTYKHLQVAAGLDVPHKNEDPRCIARPRINGMFTKLGWGRFTLVASTSYMTATLPRRK